MPSEDGSNGDAPEEQVTSGFLRISTTEEPEPFPVAIEGRDGDTLLVRRLKADEEPLPVTLDSSVKSVVLVTPVRYTGIAMTDEVGRKDDLLTWMRVVEKRREGNLVYGRTLAPDEPDTGEAILLRPGDSLTFEAGDLIVSLQSIDAIESRDFDGYAPVTGVLWTWMKISPPAHEEGYRYILSAARRLDAASRLLQQVVSMLQTPHPDVGPSLRGRMWQIVADVEVAVIAFGRAFDMAARLETLTGIAASLPSDLPTYANVVNDLRNAYEHIEDRALGQVRGRPDPAAVTIFDWEPLLTRGVLAYGGKEVDLDDLVEAVGDLRSFLIDAASALTERVVRPDTSPSGYARVVGLDDEVNQPLDDPDDAARP